jgi:hypothetical protein
MFKRLFIVIISVFLISFISIFNEKPIFSSFADSYEVYIASASSNAKIVNTTRVSYPFIRSKVGESCKIKNEFNLTDFLSEMDAKVIFTEQTEEGVSYYAYSKDIRYEKKIKDQVVNLQVHIGSAGVTVGSPIIFGSF